MKLFSIFSFFLKLLGFKAKNQNNKPASNFADFFFPTIIIHSGEKGNGGKNHLAMWVPVFQELNIPFAILVRHRRIFNYCKKQFPKIPVFFASSILNIGNFFDKYTSVKAVFYPSSTGNNNHASDVDNAQHIFIGHGDSEKAASVRRAHRIYDEIWVAGQSHIDRYLNAKFDMRGVPFKKVGRPNLQPLLERLDGAIESEGIFYAPTWEGVDNKSNYMSLPIAEEILSLCCQHFKGKVFAKLHPHLGNVDKTVKDNAMALQEKFNDSVTFYSRQELLSDVMEGFSYYICDISSTITEFLIFNKPIFVYYPLELKKIRSSSFSISSFTYTFSTPEELETLLVSVMGGHDPLAEKRELAREEFLGITAMRENAFLKEVKRVCNIS